MAGEWSETTFLTGWAILCGIAFFIVMRLTTRHERFVAKEIARAQALEQNKQFGEAAKIYRKYDYSDDANRAERCEKEQLARGYEIAMKYDEAVKLYEELQMWPDAGRARHLAEAQRKAQAPPPPQVVREHEKETIIKEIVKIPCKYCGSLVEITETKCSNCGGNLSG